MSPTSRHRTASPNVAGNARPQVGVLALQGDFREHLMVLRELGADAVPVRRGSELDGVTGLVIPGGESSVMDKLSRTFGLAEPLKARIAEGMPVYGTCAGLIMLADTVLDEDVTAIACHVVADVRASAALCKVANFVLMTW